MATSEKMVVEITPTLAAKLPMVDEATINDLLHRGLRDFHIEQALDSYRLGGMSFAAAAEQAGVSLAELARFAYVRNIEPPFDEAMVAEELH